jgi:Peptidase A4 family
MTGCLSVLTAAGLLVSGASAAPRSRDHHAHRALVRPSAVGALIPSRSGERLPVHGGTVDSLNWSGYAVTGSGITGVNSEFVVPSAGLVPPGFAASWTGVGGYSTSDLIQAGTTEDSLGNAILGPQYYAWYELLPASETQISGCTGDANCTVTPGETITVGIHQVSGASWNIQMVDSGHWSWNKTVTYTSSGSSAEWILEAPTLVAQTLVAPVGTAKFGPVSTFTQGATKPIAQGNPTTIDMSPGLINEATPSPLASDGQSFNSCTYEQTCAAP